MSRTALRGVPPATAIAAFSVYAATAARGITWWDGSSYPLAAVTLGIPGAPGSLLLVLLGWIVGKIPVVFPMAFRLNLLAAALAATMVGIVSGLGARLATLEEREPGVAEWVAGAVAGLTLAFGVTTWTYAVQFTPYVLSAVWTALILVVAFAWWRRPPASTGRGLLFLMFLLFGLDLSVHRTNLLLLPAALLWIGLRTPGSGSRWRDALASAAGLVVGLAFHLLLIPMAARHPSYLIEDTSNLDGWWSYVSLERMGGGFLVSLWPRRAPFFSVQLADYLDFLRRNLSPLWYVPVALAALGWLSTLRRHPRRAAGMLAFFLCAGLGAILYFNKPTFYMRPLDRHYLPSLVILAPWIAVGAAALLRGAARAPAGGVPATLLGLALASMPLGAWRANRRVCDLSHWRFAESFARDLLEPLPTSAILLTNGDNDSFPLWYLQQVEGVRRDVAVINLPSSNLGAYVAQVRRSDPGLSRLLERETTRGVLDVSSRADVVTTVVEPRTNLGLPATVTPPDTLSFRLTPPIYGQDRVVLDLFRLTRWRRPIHLACTVTRDNVPWLWPFARLDGLAFRIIPSEDPAVLDVDHMRRQLFERIRYAAFADTSAPLDPDSRMLCRNYVAALIQLANAQAGRGQAREALVSLRFLEQRVSPARLGMDPNEFLAPFRKQLEEAAAKQAVETQ